MYKDISTLQLSKKIGGKLYGDDVELNGEYTFLNEAQVNDIVIRHWINDKGVEIAKDRGVSCIITQNPQDNAIDVALKLDLPLIVTDNIEYATAYALSTTVEHYAKDAFKLAVTGTNGKSTTTHLLYTIFNDLGYDTYTNTDAESEGNTLIDPRVASELTGYYKQKHNIDVIALEVSEVQGWDDKLMKNHAYQMIQALNTDVSIITNASADHMNLVKSFDELLDEISGAAKALNQTQKEGLLVLNYDDENIRKMSHIIDDNPSKTLYYFGEYDSNVELDVYYKENIGIYVKDDLYIKYEDLPFTSKHFIQDIMAAIAVCAYKNLDKEKVIDSLRNYKPLARRFIKLRDNPIIIDDFAHNPSGIKHTIENGSVLGEKLYAIFAIRGSRGEDINKQIAQALVEVLNNQDNYKLILTTSTDVVNHLNTVTSSEQEIFTQILKENNIAYALYDALEQSLVETFNQANDDDVILLLGAQGMDPASGILQKNNIIQ